METLTLLKQLSEAPGPTGREETVRELIQSIWAPLVDEIRTDAMGNLIALQRGTDPEPRPALMLAAHMDEIGLVVTGIEGTFLRVAPIGGSDRRVLICQEVIVHGRSDLPGVIASRPPHVLREADRRKTVAWENLFIDTGLSAEELKAQVRVGDPITLNQPLVELKGQRIAGKALDNRASVAIVTQTLTALRTQPHAWDCYAVATVQEEIGTKGAITAAYGVHPQLAIALDVTFARQYNDSDTGTYDLGKGPALGIGSNFHPQLLERLRKTADTEEIPYLLEPSPGVTGTDAWAIQIAREGIPTALVGLPVRYMHQPVELLSLRDFERACRLLTRFITGLEADYRPRWEDEL